MAKTRFEIAQPVIDAEMAKPYVVGSADCFVLGCRIADAFVPERSFVDRFCGNYKTLRGAHRVLHRHGYSSLEAAFADHLECCPPAEAQFGDLGIVHLADGEHLVVCVQQRFLTKTPSGRSWHRLDEIRAAFRT